MDSRIIADMGYMGCPGVFSIYTQLDKRVRSATYELTMYGPEADMPYIAATGKPLSQHTVSVERPADAADDWEATIEAEFEEDFPNSSWCRIVCRETSTTTD